MLRAQRLRRFGRYGRERDRSTFLCLSHFRMENQFPFFLKML
jgi:hypothetical protein